MTKHIPDSDFRDIEDELKSHMEPEIIRYTTTHVFGRLLVAALLDDLLVKSVRSELDSRDVEFCLHAKSSNIEIILIVRCDIPYEAESLLIDSKKLFDKNIKRTPFDLPKGDLAREFPDPVNSPTHYTAGGLEVIDIIKAKHSQEEFIGYLSGNVDKYMLCYKHKNGVTDLKKAQWYLNRLINELDQKTP